MTIEDILSELEQGANNHTAVGRSERRGAFSKWREIGLGYTIDNSVSGRSQRRARRRAATPRRGAETMPPLGKDGGMCGILPVA